MKTKEEFLRESFGEIEISQIISKYPSSIQRPSIYRAMEEYASQQTAELRNQVTNRLEELLIKVKELSDFKALVKQMREKQAYMSVMKPLTVRIDLTPARSV